MTFDRDAGVGLANTRDRLDALYGEHAHLTIAENEAGGVRATVRLPFRPLTHGEESGLTGRDR